MPFSVIVTTCNNAPVLARALESVEEAIGFLEQDGNPGYDRAPEIVVVDDGSTDETERLLGRVIRGKEFYTVVRRPRPTSPACARNAGVIASRGDRLFFLDADDLCLPSHLSDCLRELADQKTAFVKTGVRLTDSVHRDWKERIEHSVVINLSVRRQCHELIGGFFDYRLLKRIDNEFQSEMDIFWKLEDQFYCEMLARFFRGVRVNRETVYHVRYPGNSFDRQYEKFQRPFGAYPHHLSPIEDFRLRLANLIFDNRCAALSAQLETAGTNLWRK